MAIVTDGLWRKSLSAIRSLGKSGFPVAVMGDSYLTTGFWSRFTTERIRAPFAAQEPAVFGELLLQAMDRHPGSVVLPMEDPSLLWVSQNREKVLRRGHVLIPSEEAIAIAEDKGRTLAIARELGLPAPRTWEPKSASEFVSVVQGLEPGAFVVKPRSGTGSAGVSYGPLQESAQWEQHWLKHGACLIQERVPSSGRGLGVSLLMDQNGECVAEFAHERLQQYPNSGGPSTDRKSIHAPELVQMSIALLKKLSWKGIAMVEWKEDPRDRKPRLMEINPRFWGSLELAVRAGVDFPALYARAALGQKLGPRPAYAANVRCRWMMPGEVLRYLSQPKEERESLGEFLRGLPGLAEEWDRDDLRGAFSTVVCTAGLALNPKYWKYVRRG